MTLTPRNSEIKNEFIFYLRIEFRRCLDLFTALTLVLELAQRSIPNKDTKISSSPKYAELRRFTSLGNLSNDNDEPEDSAS